MASGDSTLDPVKLWAFVLYMPSNTEKSNT